MQILVHLSISARLRLAIPLVLIKRLLLASCVHSERKWLSTAFRVIQFTITRARKEVATVQASA